MDIRCPNLQCTFEPFNHIKCTVNRTFHTWLYLENFTHTDRGPWSTLDQNALLPIVMRLVSSFIREKIKSNLRWSGVWGLV